MHTRCNRDANADEARNEEQCGYDAVSRVRLEATSAEALTRLRWTKTRAGSGVRVTSSNRPEITATRYQGNARGLIAREQHSPEEENIFHIG